MSDPKPFRIAFLGAGGIARSQAEVLKRLPGVQIVAAADPSEAALKKFAEIVPGVVTYAEPAALFKTQTKLDAVSVCSPNGAHCANTLEALAAGCHVIVEKPMALNAAEAERMIAAADTAKRILSIGFQWRFDNRTRHIRRMIDEGLFGRILHVKISAMRRRGIPNWGVFGRKDLQGGGPLIDIGVHVIEMAHFAIGGPRPLTASASTWTWMGDKPSAVASMWPNWDHTTYTVEDLAVGQVRLAGGALMTIESSFCAHIEKDTWNFQIMGEKAGCTFEPFQIFSDRDGMMMNMTPGYVGPNKPGPFDLKLEHFMAVCREGIPNLAPAADGLAVQRILDGLYASAAQGREISIA